MLSKEVLRKIRRIHLHARFLAGDALAGEYQSSFKGQGMEFEEVREYLPGDDVRSIDWNVSARMSSLFVKKYREERELTVFLMVDVSASGAFGTEGAFKREIAAEMAAAIAYMAIQSNDKVGVILFSDRIERFVAPQKGRNHVLRIIRDVLACEPQGTGTNLRGALDFLSRVANRRAVVFVLSDFLSQGFERSLRTVARKHDLVAVHLRDRMEDRLPDVGLLELQDAESGETLLVDAGSSRFRQEFEAAVAARRRQLGEMFRKAGVDEVGIETHRSYLEPLVAFFKRRSHRRAWGILLVSCALGWFAQGAPGLGAETPLGTASPLPAGTVSPAEETIRDIKPILPEAFPYARVLLALLVLALAIALVVWLWRRWKRREKPPMPFPVSEPVSCHKKALEALGALAVPAVGEGRSPEARELAARFHYGLSAILREYLEDCFGLNATDLTTEELWQRLQAMPAIEEQGGEGRRRWLRQILQRGDEVKYAREPVGEASLVADRDAVRGFVGVVEASRRAADTQAGPVPQGGRR